MNFATNAVGTVFREGARTVLDAVFPQTCVACGQWIFGGGEALCPGCAAALAEAASATYCQRCGRTMPAAAIHDEHCARCRSESFWNLGRVVRVGPYEAPLRAVIVGLKFTGDRRHVEFLGSRLAGALAGEPWIVTIDAFVPVPMHRLRRHQRPCDHALELANAVARHLRRAGGPRIAVQQSAIRRRSYAVSQTRAASRQQRFENVRGCFEPSRRPNVAGKTVCIIDNVIVSGATVCEVSKVLRRAGARRLYAAVVARGVTGGDRQASATAVM